MKRTAVKSTMLPATVIAAGFVLALFLLVASPSAADVTRIISLAPSVTEILFALGVGDRVVGVSTYCDYPPEATRIDRVGTFLVPNVERILAKKADLVIGVPSPGNRRAVESLRELGARVLIVDPETVASILETIRTVAAAVGVPAAGDDLNRQINGRITAITGRLSGATPRSVLMVVDRNPLIAVGRRTLQDELITMARGINVAAKAGDQWPHVGLEFVLAEAPEVIIDTSMVGDDASEAVRFWRNFPTIPAVQNKRIYGYRAFELLRPGPRVVESLATIARFVHPERFE